LKRSNRLVLLIGALLAVVAFVGIVLLLGQPSPPTQGPQASIPTTVNVVKAKVDIGAGTVVTADMVELGTLPIGAAGNTFQDVGFVIGQIVRKDARPGTILTFDYFVDTGEITDVTPGLPLGLRAMAISVDQTTGVGTLIHRGDSVDVIIGLEIQTVVRDPADRTKTKVIDVGKPGPTVKMIIQNLKVIGTLKPRAAPQAQQQQQPAASPSPGSQGQPATALTGEQELVIVALTANQAEAIRWAQLYTKPISLVLRSPKDYVAVDASGSPIPGASPVVPPLEKTDGMILKILIEKYGVLPPDILVGP
jgi:Flp pilus assembly protein CpaB